MNVKKRIYLLLCAGLILLLAQCTNKTKEQLRGIWRVDAIELNNTKMDGNAAGQWLWEFNEEGGYMIMAAGMKEKGKFSLSDKTLKLKSITNPDKEESVFTIQHLDSLHLDLASDVKGNKTLLHLIKAKDGEMEEDD
ncbi:MAG: hypothetical protein U0V74_17525 [Chitinophagales bacterium]